jgi:DNA adenine methylase
MKPFLKYAGGKTSELPVIKRYLPKTFGTIYEPFVGGGSFFLDFDEKRAVINDKARDLMDLYQAIANDGAVFSKWLHWTNTIFNSVNSVFDLLNSDSRTGDLIVLEESLQKIMAVDDSHDLSAQITRSFTKKMQRISNIEDEKGPIPDEDYKNLQETGIKEGIYTFIRSQYNNKHLAKSKRMAMYYFVREYCYSSMYRFNSDGDFNVPYGGASYNRKDYFAKVNYLLSDALIRKLSATEMHCEDFESFISRIDDPNGFIFVDPPYDTEFSTYSNMPFTKKDQERLANALAKTKSKWMVVIKATPFIESLYKSYNIIRFEKEYMVSFKNRNNRKATHLLITNYRLEGIYGKK